MLSLAQSRSTDTYGTAGRLSMEKLEQGVPAWVDCAFVFQGSGFEVAEGFPEDVGLAQSAGNAAGQISHLGELQLCRRVHSWDRSIPQARAENHRALQRRGARHPRKQAALGFIVAADVCCHSAFQRRHRPRVVHDENGDSHQGPWFPEEVPRPRVLAASQKK